MPLLKKGSGAETPDAAGSPSHAHGQVERAPEQSRAEWQMSFDLDDFPMPTGREEPWRFTPIDRLESLLRDTPSGAHLAIDTELPGEVSVDTITTATARDLGAPAPQDRAAALAIAHADRRDHPDSSGGVLHVQIPADSTPGEPVRVRLIGAHWERVWSQVLITVGAQAKAVVVLEHHGSVRLSQVVSTVVGDGAELTLVSLQEWDDDTLHLSQHDLVVGRDATVRHVAVTLGGQIVRINANVTYAGPGASAEAYGVYFAQAGQHLEHRLFVDHSEPNCRSKVEYRGALQGATARTVWVGDVLIRAAAEDTDTYEVNRNLVLSDGTRADSVPNLEIETGQIVGAGHASATGRFDDEQLFYLQARGIPEDEARALVVRGFFAEIIGKIPVAEVQGHLVAEIERELEHADVLADGISR